MLRVSTRRQVWTELASRRRTGLGPQRPSGRRQGYVVVIPQLARCCRAVGGRREGLGLIRPEHGPQGCPRASCGAELRLFFLPSPLKTGPSKSSDQAHSKERFSKPFCTLSHHFYHTARRWGWRVCREARLGETDRAGSSTLSHGGVGAQWAPRDAGMHVESRQGLYGGMTVSRGLLCTAPARAGVIEGLAPGSQPTPGSPRVARWCHRGSPSGEHRRGGEGAPVGWVALVGWAAAAASGGPDGKRIMR